MFVDFLCNHFVNPGPVHDTVCLDGPSLEFRKKFMVEVFQSLS